MASKAIRVRDLKRTFVTPEGVDLRLELGSAGSRAGAFVLDFIVKTPVATIDAYDFDTFKVHNGFRLPGEVPMDQFGHLKTDALRRKYEPFRHGLTFHNKRISAGDEALFTNTTFAFVCIDDGEARLCISR